MLSDGGAVDLVAFRELHKSETDASAKCGLYWWVLWYYCVVLVWYYDTKHFFNNWVSIVCKSTSILSVFDAKRVAIFGSAPGTHSNGGIWCLKNPLPPKKEFRLVSLRVLWWHLFLEFWFCALPSWHSIDWVNILMDSFCTPFASSRFLWRFCSQNVCTPIPPPPFVLLWDCLFPRLVPEPRALFGSFGSLFF